MIIQSDFAHLQQTSTILVWDIISGKDIIYKLTSPSEDATSFSSISSAALQNVYARSGRTASDN